MLQIREAISEEKPHMPAPIHPPIIKDWKKADVKTIFTFSNSLFPIAFDAIMAGPTPMRVLRADTTIVRGITRLIAARASPPTKCPTIMASKVTVSCIAADDNNDAHR